MKVTDTCRSCLRETTGHLFIDELGPHLVCEHCGASFDTDVVFKPTNERKIPMFKYYTTQRPPMPGTVPTTGLITIIPFEERTFVYNGIGSCWGYALYKRRLTLKEIDDYELKQDPWQADAATKAETMRHVTITRQIAGVEHTFTLSDEELRQAHDVVERQNIAADVLTYISESDTWGFDSSEFDECVYSSDDILNYEDVRLEISDSFQSNYDSNLDHWANIEKAIRAFISRY